MKNPEIFVEVRTKTKDEESARILATALNPDEKFELKGLSIETSYEGNVVKTKIFCSRGPRSLAETFNELMLAYELVLKTLEITSED